MRSLRQKNISMQVKVIDVMGTDLTVVNAARVSFKKEHIKFFKECIDKGYLMNCNGKRRKQSKEDILKHL